MVMLLLGIVGQFLAAVVCMMLFGMELWHMAVLAGSVGLSSISVGAIMALRSIPRETPSPRVAYWMILGNMGAGLAMYGGLYLLELAGLPIC